MWSYSENPAASNRDAVRFLIGDTNPAKPLLSDAEIGYVLGLYSDPRVAAAHAADSIAASYARFVDKTVGPVSVSYSQLSKQFRELADSLWDATGGRLEGPALILYSGGLSIGERDGREADTDIPSPFFTRRTGEAIGEA